MIKAPRGTHDILPDEQQLFRHVTTTFTELAERYGYRAITTPIIEHVELIERTSGEGSDIIQKEIYTLVDRSERTLALRPEATAPVARAYLEHGMHREPQPVKTYLVGQMFRYDRPQRGRFREFWQLNVEAMGSEDPALDAEVIQLYDELLRQLGIRRYWLELNSIGDRECRPAYVEKLNEWLEAHPDVLTSDVEQKRATSPLRVFDVKDERGRQALEGAPKIGESLCDSCREHFEAVRRYLDAAGVQYRLSPTLVRGLDYYTRTTFEFLGEALGAKDSILGGGRYDYLIEQIGGPPTPGVGWAAGVERLLLQVQEEGGVAGELGEPSVDVFFAFEDGAPREQIVGLMADLRRSGRSVDTDYAGRSLKGQLTQAGRLGAATTVIVKDGEALLRRAGTEDEVVPLDALEKAL
jgi:histidyl-tRNA synthetase